jgi:excisionase family DNA binding protein
LSINKSIKFDLVRLPLYNVRMDDQLITPQEVAQLKSVHVTVVYNAIRSGRLPHTKVLGRYGVRRTDADAWQPDTWGGKRPGGGRPKQTNA